MAAPLWPEVADPTPGFHETDEVENYQHDQVCQHGTMTLAELQQAIAVNWLAAYAGACAGVGRRSLSPLPPRMDLR